MSLGRAHAGHSFEHKLNMAQKYGYQGIEMFYEDLIDLARKSSPEHHTSPADSDPSQEAQLATARQIRQMCKARSLEIICLQPFAGYEGLLDPAQQERHIAKLHFWIDLAHELGTDTIQIPSSFLPPGQVTEDLGAIAADLRRVADIGAEASPPVRYVYEALCWGTRVDTWERCWDVVRRVDRPNLGVCLDSYNIAGRIYADPAAASGTTADADGAVARSMERLVAGMDVAKVFYVQIVDAERLGAPLVAGHRFHDAAQPPRMSWSRNCRLFYGEEERGAYLPVREISEAIFRGLGFEGWVSLELFNRRMGDEDPEVPEELARRGAVSWDKLVKDMDLTVDPPAAVADEPRIWAAL